MIGVFDSGVGGLTVLKHIHTELPEYSTLYLGDSARAPYGDRSHEQITEFAWEGIEYLFNQGCPLVIVACNSASAQALRTIQQTKLDPPESPLGKGGGEAFEHRVLGVIRPTAEELAGQFKTVGILATSATVGSEAYVKEFKKINPNVHIEQHACPAWGPLVEEGLAHDSNTHKIIEQDLNILLSKNSDIEAILLACTHYPVLYDYIRSILPKNIALYDQGPLVAKSLKDYLSRHPEIESQLEKSGERQYFTTGDPKKTRTAARQIADMNPNFQHVDL